MREYREQERRDKADTAVVQAARRRVRAELRKRQIVRQKIHDRRAVPMGLMGSDDRAPRHERSASVAYRLPSPSWPRRGTNRSIHIEPLTGLWHISKPRRHQIYPRCLYAYGNARTF